MSSQAVVIFVLVALLCVQPIENYSARPYVRSSELLKRRSDICKRPVDEGPCFTHIRSYYYDQGSRSCRPFIYRGCEGNNNRFRSLNDCEDVCGGNRLWKLLKDIRANFEKHLKAEKNQAGQKAIMHNERKPGQFFVSSGPPRNYWNFTSKDIPNKCRDQEPNLTLPEDRDSRLDSKSQEIEYNLPERTTNIPFSPGRKDSYGVSANKPPPYFLKRPRYAPASSNLDEIDLLFLSYAKSIKKLSLAHQALIKFEFAELLMKGELDQQAVTTEKAYTYTFTPPSNASNKPSTTEEILIRNAGVFQDVDTTSKASTTRRTSNMNYKEIDSEISFA